MKNSNKLYLKINITKIGLTLRITILAFSFVLLVWGGFLRSEYFSLLFIMIPLNCFYTTLFAKFIIRNLYKYPNSGSIVNVRYRRFGYSGMLMINLVEILLIVIKGFFATPTTSLFLWFLVAIEGVFGLFAGFYISDLFAEQR